MLKLIFSTSACGLIAPDYVQRRRQELFYMQASIQPL